MKNFPFETCTTEQTNCKGHCGSGTDISLGSTRQTLEIFLLFGWIDQPITATDINDIKYC